MPLIFRQLEGSILNWELSRLEEESWLGKDEVRGDALKSLQTQRSRLSIFRLESESQVDRVIAATMARRPRISQVTFALVDEAVLASAGFVLEETLGEVPDKEVSNWHRDVVHLSAGKVADLAHKIQFSASIGRRLDQEVGKLLNASIVAKFVDISDLEETMKADLAKQKYQPSL